MPKRRRQPDPEPFRPPGFVVCYHGTHEVCEFIPCDAPVDSRMRDRVHGGLFHKVDWERFYVIDVPPPADD